MKRLALFERVAWGVGLLLIAVFTIAKLQGAVSSRLEIARFQAARTAYQEAAQRATGARAPVPVPTGVDFTLWSEGRIRAYQSHDEEGRQPQALALLEIPRLGLTVPVLEGTDEFTLNRGVGHIEGTALPGECDNVGIAGHRDGFFRVLKDVTDGDTITLVTLWETMHYTVEDTRIVEPEEIQVLDPTSTPVLTLVTCFPFYYVGNAPERYVVRARLTSEGH
ncbi:MAG TPA: class D sortase [Thermoanaerobaculaceae bacterium]|nr:class D sortase [Thermoanaerobaculaceae bacterium]